MSPPPYDLTDSAKWLTALSQGTGVMHTMGPQAAAENTSVDRFEWQPMGFESVAINYVNEDTEAVGDLGGVAFLYVVTIIAADIDALGKRRLDLDAWVDILFGPPQGGTDTGGGYKIDKSTAPVKGGVPGASAWSCKVPVSLTSAVPRRVFPPRTIVSTSVEVDAADADGADQAIPVLNG